MWLSCRCGGGEALRCSFSAFCHRWPEVVTHGALCQCGFSLLLRVSSGGGAWRHVGSASLKCLAGPLSSRLKCFDGVASLSLSFAPCCFSAHLSCRRSSEALGWLETCLQLGAQAALSLGEAAVEVGVLSGPLALYGISVQRV
ncbi:unnamed protein product [Brassica oleracea var. botrytis]|uniref:(rape) hypothetical protein n=1 Tax=Brassica napus TaxID=3708 RepID=A0A816UFI8_BRANA|nr:unnamed protein product [Brassica napus]